MNAAEMAHKVDMLETSFRKSIATAAEIFGEEWVFELMSRACTDATAACFEWLRTQDDSKIEAMLVKMAVEVAFSRATASQMQLREDAE